MKAPFPTLVDSIEAFGVNQDYDQYLDSDHDTWRCAMQNLARVLALRCAVPYASALRACGLRVDRLPRQAEINSALSKFGWRTMMVHSFIPPQSFMRMQACRTIPITRHVRARSQLAYTPIPDILHEAAGHLPMLVDSDYRDFMQRFGARGQTLKYSALDDRVYAAQKKFAEYSGIPTACADRLEAMQVALSELRRMQRQALTPACLVSRFHWWTVEYGLVGADARLFGAGLLSSSKEALAAASTTKFRLSLDCLNFDYEISRLQPQLFVADDWVHLNDQFDRLMDQVI